MQHRVRACLIVPCPVSSARSRTSNARAIRNNIDNRGTCNRPVSTAFTHSAPRPTSPPRTGRLIPTRLRKCLVRATIVPLAARPTPQRQPPDWKARWPAAGTTPAVGMRSEGRSPARTNSDDLACLIPARLASGPEPLHVAGRASWVGGTAESAHGTAEPHSAVPPINSVTLSGERKPHKRPFRVPHGSEHERQPRHPLYASHARLAERHPGPGRATVAAGEVLPAIAVTASGQTGSTTARATRTSRPWGLRNSQKRGHGHGPRREPHPPRRSRPLP